MKTITKIFRGIFYFLIAIVAIFSIIYFSTSGPWQVAKTVAQDPTISHVTIDDVVFHAETHGSDTAQTIIVIHGGPGQDYRYLLSLKALADEYKVVFYDQRGTGLSPRVDAEELTLENSIEDLNRIVNYYCPDEKVNILGHSWGAMLGSAYLAKYPGKVHKIILAEPGFLTSEMAEEFMERTNGFSIDFSFKTFMTLGKIVMQALHLRGPDDHIDTTGLGMNLRTQRLFQLRTIRIDGEKTALVSFARPLRRLDQDSRCIDRRATIASSGSDKVGDAVAIPVPGPVKLRQIRFAGVVLLRQEDAAPIDRLDVEDLVSLDLLYILDSP